MQTLRTKRRIPEQFFFYYIENPRFDTEAGYVCLAGVTVRSSTQNPGMKYLFLPNNDFFYLIQNSKECAVSIDRFPYPILIFFL